MIDRRAWPERPRRDPQYGHLGARDRRDPTAQGQRELRPLRQPPIPAAIKASAKVSTTVRQNASVRAAIEQIPPEARPTLTDQPTTTRQTRPSRNPRMRRCAGLNARICLGVSASTWLGFIARS